MTSSTTPKKPDPYDWTIIHNYGLWSLRVNTKQGNNIGRAIVWLHRSGNMRSITLLTKAERDELWDKIVPKYEAVMETLFHPDRFNYSWLGNLTDEHGGHGHLHCIPRYSAPIKFEGVEFIDPTYGKMYTSPNGGSELDLIIKIRDTIAVHL